MDVFVFGIILADIRLVNPIDFSAGFYQEEWGSQTVCLIECFLHFLLKTHNMSSLASSEWIIVGTPISKKKLDNAKCASPLDFIE